MKNPSTHYLAILLGLATLSFLLFVSDASSAIVPAQTLTPTLMPNCTAASASICIPASTKPDSPLGPAGCAQTYVYDLTDDWSDISNPNGAWRLYKAPEQLFTVNQPDWYSNGTNQHGWADAPYPEWIHVPVWMKTIGDMGVGLPEHAGFVDAGTIVVHGAESGRTGTELSSVTWTSSLTGTASITGGAWVAKAHDRPMIWEFKKNGISLTLGLLTQADPYTRTNPYNFANGSGGVLALTMDVVPNDTIELLVYRHPVASYSTFVAVKLRISVFVPCLRYYLPIILVSEGTTFPIHIGDAIPIRTVVNQGEIFYTRDVLVPSTLPLDGHFYLSSQPYGLAEVLVDDEVAILLDNTQVFAYNFSTNGTPISSIVTIPNAIMNQLAGQTARIEYRDIYGDVTHASTMWLIWMP